MLDESIFEARCLIERRHEHERNLRARALEAALELNGDRRRSVDELISDAERLLSFLQVPSPPPFEIPAAALESA